MCSYGIKKHKCWYTIHITGYTINIDGVIYFHVKKQQLIHRSAIAHIKDVKMQQYVKINKLLFISMISSLSDAFTSVYI